MRALIVDDHPSDRAGLSAMLWGDPRFLMVAEAISAAGAIDCCASIAYHVVLLDSCLPGADCVATVRALSAAVPSIRILLLLEEPDGIILVAALKSGAHGAVAKSEPLALILEAAAVVGAGGCYLSDGACVCMIRQLHMGGLHDLAPRELEVVRLIALGKANKEIATVLAIAEGTVKKLRARGMKKLGARTTVELLNAAARKGWISFGQRAELIAN